MRRSRGRNGERFGSSDICQVTSKFQLTGLTQVIRVSRSSISRRGWVIRSRIQPFPVIRS
jgi:hypothetical protein